MKGTTARTSRNLSRQHHRFQIIAYLRRCDEVSPSQIAADLGISLPTVVRVLADLTDEGFVENLGREAASVGRPASRVRFRGNAHAVIAVYAHVTGLFGIVADLSGNILRQNRLDACSDGEENVNRLIELIRTLRNRPLPGIISCRGIGVAVQSMVRQPEGVVVMTMWLGWQNMPLRQRLQAEFAEPVLVDADRYLGVAGEWAFGVGDHADHLVRLSIGPGASAGIIVGGEVLRGATDAAGELKWFLDDPRLGGHNLPLLGNRQTLRFDRGIPHEAFAALERAADRYDRGDVALSDFDSERPEDSEHAIVCQLLDYATMAAANVSAIVNPSRIVLTGLITRGGPFVTDVLAHRMGGDVFPLPELRLSHLGPQAVLLGAVKMILDKTTLQPLP